MFNNIIHFIIVLLIHNLSFPGDGLETSLSYALMMLFLSWLVYAGICRWSFQRLLDRAKGARADNGPLAKEYQRLVLRLSILAIFLFASDVYMFNLKYWLQSIPGFKHFSVLQGILAILLFIFYLGTIWHYSHPAYVITFQTRIVRRSFIISNLKFNLPIVFPWLILSFVFDIVSFIPWSGPESFLNEPGGQIVFFAIFLAILMVFLPRLIQYWWGCRPFEPTGRARELKAFLKGKDFKYRDLLKWPIFEGRIMTAGIMGIVPRYRYILITDALMEILSLEELKAVVAHEMGHAKYRHLVFYIFFILGYMFLSFGLFDLFRYFFVVQPFFIRMFESGESQGPTLFYLALSLPTLFSLIVYFRYVMGFFMR
ncbi:MAG: M48 family metallopeptidase, partial [Desulfatiglandales bacterium]|nr:M48 family metallopeptidase [Desulfatiglandales bacterium]